MTILAELAPSPGNIWRLTCQEKLSTGKVAFTVARWFTNKEGTIKRGSSGRGISSGFSLQDHKDLMRLYHVLHDGIEEAVDKDLLDAKLSQMRKNDLD